MYAHTHARPTPFENLKEIKRKLLGNPNFCVFLLAQAGLKLFDFLTLLPLARGCWNIETCVATLFI